MKKTISFVLIGVAMVVSAAMLHAATATYTLTATLPSITGASMAVQKITNDVWASVSGTALNFGTLKLETFANGDQAYLPESYFAIDIAGTGGAGTPSTVVTYTEGSSPSGSTVDQKLGNRGNITFKALKYKAGANPDQIDMASHPATLLKNVSGKTITPAQIVAAGGSWLRIYLGLNDGKTTGMVPFNPGDPAGAYTGQLTITTTP